MEYIYAIYGLVGAVGFFLGFFKDFKSILSYLGRICATSIVITVVIWQICVRLEDTKFVSSMVWTVVYILVILSALSLGAWFLKRLINLSREKEQSRYKIPSLAKQ